MHTDTFDIETPERSAMIDITRRVARVVAADAVDFVAASPRPIDLLYLDADGGPKRGKGIYLDILRAAGSRIPPGGLVLAHNSVNAAERLADYLGFLAGGCSKDPLDLLRGAGVDLERPEAVDTALAKFARLVEELDALV